jgi:pSer/pThr/pTyr-binding forkhead associated (FHA) protein
VIFWFEHRGMRYRIHEGETLVGRGGRSALFIDVPSVSREHAIVRRAAEHVEITDLGSSNGTFVNGERLTGTRTLAAGDEVRLGGAALLVGATDAPMPSNVGAGIEIIEQQSHAPHSELSTEPEFSSIDVLESLVVGAGSSQNPTELAQMIKSSVDRLLDTAHKKGQKIGPDQAARIVSIVEIVAGWFPDGTLSSWAKSTSTRLGL